MRGFEYAIPDTSGDWTLALTSCVRKPSSWTDEFHRNVFKIVNDAGAKHIWLCVGGGIEGEIMCRIFFDLGVTFSVLVLDFDGGAYNTGFLKQWCQDRLIKVMILTMAVQELIAKDIPAHISEGTIAKSVSPYLQIAMIKKVEELGGYGVLCSSEHITFSLFKEEVGISFEYDYIVARQWCDQRGIAHECHFLQSTPELFSAYLQLPIIRFLQENPRVAGNQKSTPYIKMLAHLLIWPDAVARRKYRPIEIKKRLKEENVHLSSTFSYVKPCILSLAACEQQMRVQLHQAVDKYAQV